MSAIIKSNILMQYITQIRSKVLVRKKQAIQKARQRRDHQMILVSEFMDESERATAKILHETLNEQYFKHDPSSELKRMTIKFEEQVESLEESLEAFVPVINARNRCLSRLDDKI